MQINFGKLCSVIGFICMSVFSIANAEMNNIHPQHDSISSQNPYHTAHQGFDQKETYREITPNAGPRVLNGADVFITADFIWWKTTQDGSRYASTGVYRGSNPTSTNVSQGNSYSIGDSWNPGFKVGLGLNFEHDGWDIYAEYTWLRPKNSRGVSQPINTTTGAAVTSRQTPNTANGPYGNAAGSLWIWDQIHAHWRLQFNVIDLELGRNFYVSQFLTMRPFIGLKGTWQKQSMNTRLHNSNGIDSGIVGLHALSGPYRIHQTNDIWGIGIRSGFDMSWCLSKNWSIYGDLAWTTMWTDYTELQRKDTLDNTTGLSPIMVDTNAHHWYSVKCIGEMELGIRWEMWFSDDNYHFAIQAGWEQQVWLSWNTFDSLTESDHWNDLNFHGLNLKLRFDF